MDNHSPNCFGEKMKNKTAKVRPRVQNFRVSTKNGVDIWSFVRKNEQDMIFPSNYLVLE